jgi:hypothetical protein
MVQGYTENTNECHKRDSPHRCLRSDRLAEKSEDERPQSYLLPASQPCLGPEPSCYF